MTDPTTSTSPPLSSEPYLPHVGGTFPGRRVSPMAVVVAIVIFLVVGVLVFFGLKYLVGGSNTNIAVPSTIEQATSYTYVSADYGFSVDFPAKPVETFQSQSAAGYDLDLLLVQWVSTETVYAAGAVHIPAELLEQDLDVMLQNSIGGAATATGSVLSEQTFVELDGERAVQGTLTYANGQVGSSIFVFHDGTQYSLTSIDAKENFSAFVDSFSFTG